MIILDPADQHPTKVSGFVAGPTLRAPERVSTNGSPLPDYETSQAQHWHPVPPLPKPSSQSKPLSRFWRITLYVLAVYVALTIAIGVPLIVTSFRRKNSFHPPKFSWEDEPNSQGSIVMALDADDCDDWAYLHDSPVESIFTANITHSLAASDSIILQSNLSPDDEDSRNISGSLLVDFNDDPSEDNTVVLLAVRSSSAYLRSNTRACFREYGPNRGLQIYTPRDRTDNDSMDITLTLLFPRSSSPYSLEDLTTSLPLFAQTYAQLSPTIKFRTVLLDGASEAISCYSIDAERITIRNSQASISGTFNVTEKLSLDNVEGPIDANITLFHGGKGPMPPSLHMDTGNSGLDARITLSSYSTRSSRHGPPNYRGNVENFNGPISLNVSYDEGSTQFVPYEFRIVNNQGTCDVSVDEHYHGLFEVYAKLSTVRVEAGEQDGDDDPAGKGRIRRLEFDQNSNGQKRGWIGWGVRPDFWNPGQDGKIKVTSSLKPINLRLGGERT